MQAATPEILDKLDTPEKRVKLGKQTPSQRTDTTALAVLGLLLLAFVPYLNSLFNSFVYDDRLQLVGNPYVHSFRYLPNIFGSTVWTFQGAQGISNYYRPLMTLAYLVCFKMYGAIPFGFHLLNVTLHAIVVLLLFAVTERLFKDRMLSLVAAGLFALHPIHTESVAWIAGVTDLELSVFFLLTFLLYLRLQRDEPPYETSWWRLLPMLGTYALALLSKEQALLLPAVAAVYEHFYRPGHATTSWRVKLGRYLPLWAMAGAYILFRQNVLGGFAPAVSRPDLPWSTVFVTGTALVGAYLGKLLWPVHLVIFYVFHEVTSITDPRFLAGVVGLLTCLALFVWLWRREHLMSFSFLWMGATLGPVLNARWMPAGVFAERYLYLPSAAFCWLVGWAAIKAWRSASPASTFLTTAAGTPAATSQASPSPSPSKSTSRTPSAWQTLVRGGIPAALAILAVFYGVRTVLRNRDWRTEDRIYNLTLEVQPDAQLIRTNLGVLYWEAGDKVGAEREWTKSLTGPHKPYAPTLNDLGLVRVSQDRIDEAVSLFNQALAIGPKYMDPHKNLAVIYAEQGRFADADREFREAVKLAPLSADAHNTFGRYLLEHGRRLEAGEQFALSAKVDDNAEAQQNLGDILLSENAVPEARRAYEAALKLYPFQSKAHFGMAQVHEREGRMPEALSEYNKALETDPTNTQAVESARRLSAQLAPH